MSIVGTRPPLVSETNLYEPHHKVRLLKADAVKNGTYYCHVGGWEDEYAVPQKATKIVCDDWHSLKHRGSPTIARMYKDGLLSCLYMSTAIFVMWKKLIELQRSMA